jgi:hypothetical protein
MRAGISSRATRVGLGRNHGTAPWTHLDDSLASASTK